MVRRKKKKSLPINALFAPGQSCYRGPCLSIYEHAGRWLRTPSYSSTASAQLRKPPSSSSTRVMSSLASRTKISNGASALFTGCLRRGRKMIPPSLGAYVRLINSGRPARDCLPWSVPGIPQLRSAPKFSHEDMYISEPNVKARESSVSVIWSIDLKNLRWRETQSLSTPRMVLWIFWMTRTMVDTVTLGNLVSEIFSHARVEVFAQKYGLANVWVHKV